MLNGPVRQQQRKVWHDRQLREIGVPGCLVLQYEDYIPPGKLKTKWLGPFQVQSFLYIKEGQFTCKTFQEKKILPGSKRTSEIRAEFYR